MNAIRSTVMIDDVDHFNIITIVIITAAYIHAAPRVAVLSSGLMARGVKTATTLEAGLCRSGAVRLQDKASASQRRFVFEMLEKFECERNPLSFHE